MLVVKEKEVSKLTDQLQALQEEGQKDSAAVEAAEQHFRAVSAGLSTNEDGEEATLAGQMMTCKNDMSKADTEAKQVRKGLKHICCSWYPGLQFIFNGKFSQQKCMLDGIQYTVYYKPTVYEIVQYYENIPFLSSHLTNLIAVSCLCPLAVQAQMTLKHAHAELKTKQAEMKKMDSGYKKDQDTLQAIRSSREKLQAELAKLNYEGLRQQM